MDKLTHEEIREKIRQRYAQAITEKNGCGCGSAFIRAKKTKNTLQAGTDYIIRRTKLADFKAIHELLTANHLTCAGVDPATGDYFAAKSGELIVGVIGFEKYGSSALVRSFAVRSEFRQGGIGAALVRYVLDRLTTEGISSIYLLTNTIEKYMVRFGFGKISRQDIPSTVLESSALGSTCPAGSTCMKLG